MKLHCFPHMQSSLTSLAFAPRQQEGIPPVQSTRKLGPLDRPGRIDVFGAHPGALSHESADPCALWRRHYLFPILGAPDRESRDCNAGLER
jgi:hypothetical protein